MANLKWSGLDETYREMQLAGQQAGETAQRMIEAGAQECVKAWKDAISMHGHAPPGKSRRATGDLLNAVGVKYKNKGGVRTAEIYPLGKDRHGKRLAEIAFVLHYGTSKTSGDHFVDDAQDMAEISATAVMKEIWEQSK